MRHIIIDQAVKLLNEGNLVAFPTETVYGLGADAANGEAIELLYRVKGRPSTHPSIVHLCHMDQLKDWALEIPDTALRLAKRFWPGPMTLILKKQPSVLPQVTGGQNTVGIRFPSHPLAIELIKAFGRGIVAPSANHFGEISPTTAQHVIEDFGDTLPLVLDGGPCRVGVESTIIDCSHRVPKILRPGMLTSDILKDYLKASPKDDSSELDNSGKDNKDIRENQEEVRAPGTLTRHYSPRSLSKTVPLEELYSLVEKHSNWEKIAVLAISPEPKCLAENFKWVKMPEEPREYAQKLYSWLRYLDAMHPNCILVEKVPNKPQWEAIADRIKRATAKS